MITKKITVINDFLLHPTFASCKDAINYGKSIDQKQKSELALDVTSIQGLVVKQFYWDTQNLVATSINQRFPLNFQGV